MTGGSRGIGAAVCVALAEAGWDVVVNYAGDATAAEDVATRVRAAGREALVVRADVGDPAAVRDLFDEAAVWRGPVRAVVLNAGVTGGKGRVDEVDASTLDRVLAVNVAGAFHCAAAAVRLMSTRHGGGGGAIVLVSSRAAVWGSGGEWVHYAMTKGAVDTLTVGLAREVGPEDIRVNAVAPGLIETELHAAAGDPDRPRRMSVEVPLGRAGTPEEVATAVRWLLSEEASFVTGTVVGIGGGR